LLLSCVVSAQQQLHLMPTGVSQQQLDELSAQLPRVQQRQANAASGRDGTLK
jgi:hypothetical protein